MKASRKTNNKFFWILSIVILVLLIASRFLYIGYRPAHHDEGMLAYFAHQLATQGSYIYTPQIHGPVLFYLTALVFKLTLFKGALRVSMAVCGVALALVAWLYMRKESKKTALIIPALILVSPMLTYYSRFLVHTGIVIVFSLGFVFALRAYLKNFRPLNLFLSAFFLALGFGTSETTYIFCAILVAFIPIYFLLNRASFADKWQNIKKFTKQNIYDLLSAILIFLITWLLIYSVGLTNLESLKISWPNPFNSYYGLGFWLAQHPVKLGGQPWFYYIMLTAVYELPVLLAFFFMIPRVIKNRRPFELFLLWWTLGTYIGFSWAGEKFPWLFMPALISITTASGYYLGSYWGEIKKAFKVILVIMLIWAAFVNIRLNFIWPDNTVELPVYVQTPRTFEDLENKMKSDCTGREKDCILIDPKITWPLSWDFVDSGRLEEFSEQSNLENTYYAIISPESNQDAFKDGWKKDVVQLRDWWVPEKCSKIECTGKYINYYFTRKIWNPKGGFDIYLYSKIR